MNTGELCYPFDAERCIGTVCEVGPSFAKANLPSAALPEGQWHHGTRLGMGEVGDFVVIECGEAGILGRLTSVRLPERERLSVEPELGKSREAHPVGTVQLLTTIRLKGNEVTPGVARYPRLGSKVYAVHPHLMKWLAEANIRRDGKASDVCLKLAHLPTDIETTINLTPEALFGRHCGVLGATGGGKSWTLARIVEQLAECKSKAILFDATGEFQTLGDSVTHLHIGHDPDPKHGSTEVVLPYRNLTESDLLALFRPSGQSQAPKLRAAMKTLKVLDKETALGTNGIYVKANKTRKPFEDAYRKHVAVVEGPGATFDVFKLSQQLHEECVWPTAQQDASKWGGYTQEINFLVGLISRIEDITRSGELACLFSAGTSLFDQIAAFLDDANKRILRVSLKYLPFAYSAREIVANAIGRHVLALARDRKFTEKPLVVLLDEAHQFLDKSLGEHENRYPLDAFELIAKEGRKYCLNICIATQRPRDIPEGVLSQMGTLIVHRLTNDKDREVVERASGDIDRSAAAFLPTLGPGQAVIIGVDFPMPLTVQIAKPGHKPDSRGPDYQCHWKP